jgi:hypothetical protein
MANAANLSSGLTPSARDQQLPPFIVFCVQLATELTSRAAPRTVLQAAIAKATPINPTVMAFWNMVVLLIVTARTNAGA